MARINLEASAALAEWIDLYRRDPGGRLYTSLVDRAIGYLPADAEEDAKASDNQGVRFLLADVRARKAWEENREER